MLQKMQWKLEGKPTQPLKVAQVEDGASVPDRQDYQNLLTLLSFHLIFTLYNLITLHPIPLTQNNKTKINTQEKYWADIGGFLNLPSSLFLIKRIIKQVTSSPAIPYCSPTNTTYQKQQPHHITTLSYDTIPNKYLQSWLHILPLHSSAAPS